MMILFLLVLILITVAIVLTYSHVKTLAEKIDTLAEQHADMKKQLDEIKK
jgi:cell division protein FtsB